MTDEVVVNEKGELVALNGKDAVSMMRVAMIISGIQMNISTGGAIQITRGATITVLLKLASEYTGKPYKRTEKEQAIVDLKLWLDTMRLAIPTRCVK